jgi:hypothetical protein
MMKTRVRLVLLLFGGTLITLYVVLFALDDKANGGTTEVKVSVDSVSRYSKPALSSLR